jgi:hypothetical protein
MKKTIFALVLTSLTAASVANAQLPLLVGTHSADLDRVQLDKKVKYPASQQGKISVNYDAGEVTLTVYPQGPACDHEMCPMWMIAPLIVQLPITDIRETTCGNIRITAEKNMLPVDGALQRLTVIDRSQDYCFYEVAPEGVEVLYTTQSSGFNIERKVVKTRSKFSGRLALQQEAFPALQQNNIAVTEDGNI